MLSKTPQGYKVAFQARTSIGLILEMIPESESLDQWTEMLTVQIMRNTNGHTLSSFYSGMKELWAAMCPCGSTEIVERGSEQLHPTLFWAHACPLNKNTGQPENTWFKLAIRGGNLIVVQKAFKFEPSSEAVALWLAFLRELRVNQRLET
jgi:hypothetical protein